MHLPLFQYMVHQRTRLEGFRFYFVVYCIAPLGDVVAGGVEFSFCLVELGCSEVVGVEGPVVLDHLDFIHCEGVHDDNSSIKSHNHNLLLFLINKHISDRPFNRMSPRHQHTLPVRIHKENSPQVASRHHQPELMIHIPAGNSGAEFGFSVLVCSMPQRLERNIVQDFYAAVKRRHDKSYLFDISNPCYLSSRLISNHRLVTFFILHMRVDVFRE